MVRMVANDYYRKRRTSAAVERRSDVATASIIVVAKGEEGVVVAISGDMQSLRLSPEKKKGSCRCSCRKKKCSCRKKKCNCYCYWKGSENRCLLPEEKKVLLSLEKSNNECLPPKKAVTAYYSMQVNSIRGWRDMAELLLLSCRGG